MARKHERSRSRPRTENPGTRDTGRTTVPGPTSDLGTNRERHRGHEADEADVEPGTEEIRDRAHTSGKS